jgi:hypothetical protein
MSASNGRPTGQWAVVEWPSSFNGAVDQRLGIGAIVSDDDAFDRVAGIPLYKPEPEP